MSNKTSDMAEELVNEVLDQPDSEGWKWTEPILAIVNKYNKMEEALEFIAGLDYSPHITHFAQLKAKETLSYDPLKDV